MKQYFLILLSLFFANVFSQVTNTGFADTTGGEHLGKITVGGYLDTYYAYNFSEPNGNTTPYFVSSNRHNEVNINLAYVDLRYNTQNVRARLVPGFGTYVNANYATEPGVLKNLMEASVGIKLLKNKNYWLDYGVIGSPFTNESYVSKDHLIYSRSFAAENVPYYLCGARMTMPLSAKTTLYLYLLNGWQQIMNQNNHLSFGSQLEYRPNSKNLINWNTYVGDEKSATNPTFGMRYFSDIYWIYDSGNKFSSTACAYVGMQEKDNKNKLWWQANYTVKYAFNNKLSLSGRVEYFNDKSSIMLNNITGNSGFSSFGSSLCFNVKIGDHAIFRIENRAFLSEENAYICNKGIDTKFMNWALSNITVWF